MTKIPSDRWLMTNEKFLWLTDKLLTLKVLFCSMQNISAQGPKSNQYIYVLKMFKLIQGILPVQIMARSDYWTLKLYLKWIPQMQVLFLVQFCFEPVNFFEKCSMFKLAQKTMFSGKHSWVIVIERKPFVHQVKSAPIHKLIDSTKINYQVDYLHF